jgi:hypothetical protein
VAEPLLTNLLRDSQRVHRRRVRVAEKSLASMKPLAFCRAGCLVDGSVPADNLGEKFPVVHQDVGASEQGRPLATPCAASIFFFLLSVLNAGHHGNFPSPRPLT